LVADESRSLNADSVIAAVADIDASYTAALNLYVTVRVSPGARRLLCALVSAAADSMSVGGVVNS